MTAALIVPLVIAGIYLARSKLGDATYDRIIITIFKAVFLALGAALVIRVLYVNLIR